MEAERSHDPPSAHWSLRKAAGVIHSQSGGLRGEPMIQILVSEEPGVLRAASSQVDT